MRRATVLYHRWLQAPGYFYPRSPCGERPRSPEALLLVTVFLSTLSLRRATADRAAGYSTFGISIHALLAESDQTSFLSAVYTNHFYPRSPCGERRKVAGSFFLLFNISIHALLAESDKSYWISISGKAIFLSTLSLRRATCKVDAAVLTGFTFLSTLSLRRATGGADFISTSRDISIHALLAESDGKSDI